MKCLVEKIRKYCMFQHEKSDCFLIFKKACLKPIGYYYSFKHLLFYHSIKRKT